MPGKIKLLYVWLFIILCVAVGPHIPKIIQETDSCITNWKTKKIIEAVRENGLSGKALKEKMIKLKHQKTETCICEKCYQLYIDKIMKINNLKIDPCIPPRSFFIEIRKLIKN